MKLKVYLTTIPIIFTFFALNMEYLIISLIVLLAALMTFFSGFGLGTIMLPVFSIFFPLPVAVGATAIVHLANNLFKITLIFKNIDYKTFFAFGIPAFICSMLGAYLLGELSGSMPIGDYYLFGKRFEITELKLIIGGLMIFFALFDLIPKLNKLHFNRKWIALGGVLSGFFGGLSGHQGAFRSAFLTKVGLTKEQFISTSSAIAVVIDISRILVYYKTLDFLALSNEKTLIIVAMFAAFIGTFIGTKVLHKTTMKGIQSVVGVFLILLGGLFVAGIL